VRSSPDENCPAAIVTDAPLRPRRRLCCSGRNERRARATLS
jgi:hypothetical protein